MPNQSVAEDKRSTPAPTIAAAVVYTGFALGIGVCISALAGIHATRPTTVAALAMIITVNAIGLWLTYRAVADEHRRTRGRRRHDGAEIRRLRQELDELRDDRRHMIVRHQAEIQRLTDQHREELVTVERRHQIELERARLHGSAETLVEAHAEQRNLIEQHQVEMKRAEDRARREGRAQGVAETLAKIKKMEEASKHRPLRIVYQIPPSN